MRSGVSCDPPVLLDSAASGVELCSFGENERSVSGVLVAVAAWGVELDNDSGELEEVVMAPAETGVWKGCARVVGRGVAAIAESATSAGELVQVFSVVDIVAFGRYREIGVR